MARPHDARHRWSRHGSRSGFSAVTRQRQPRREAERRSRGGDFVGDQRKARMTWNELLFDFVTLWVTVDPIGTVPLYLAVTKEMPAKDRRRAAVRATIIAFVLLAAFLYFGQLLLRMMRIELLSFQIAGGIVLFLFSLTMIFDKGSSHSAAADPEHDVAVFPLAMPSIAGPGALL